jgi:hypothetical protein
MQMKHRVVPFPALAGIAVFGMFWIASCRESGKVTVDPEKARVHIISSTQGEAYIKSFKEADAELSRLLKDSSFLARQFQLPVAEAFNRDAIGALLNAEGAQGIRVYLGRDASGQIRLVLTPIDKNGQDILTKLIPDVTEDQSGPQPRARIAASQMVETGQRCPTQCDTANQ